MYVRQHVGPIPRLVFFPDWPKAIITVAWGETPGNRDHSTCLAEGHNHLGGQTSVTMAFGQTIEGTRVTWGGAALAPGYDEYGLRPTKWRLENDLHLLALPKVALSN